MGVIQTAQMLYAENQEYTMGKAVKEAVRASLSAAIHPTNIIGRIFGYGGFAHTLARRRIGEPTYEQGGIRNVFKGDEVVKERGQKSRSSQIAAQAQNAVRTGRSEIVQLQTLGKIELNTNQSVGYLQKMMEGMTASKQESAAALEEKTTEMMRNIMPANAMISPAANDNESRKSGNSPLMAILGLLAGGATAAMSLGSGLLGGLLGGLGSAGAFALRFVPFGLPGILIGLALWRAWEGITAGIESYKKDGDLMNAFAEGLNAALFGIPKALAEIMEKVLGSPKDLYNRLGMNSIFGEWDDTKPSITQKPTTSTAGPTKPVNASTTPESGKTFWQRMFGGDSKLEPAATPAASKLTVAPGVNTQETNPALMAKVNALQGKFGKKLTIISGKRDAAHNAGVGGAKGSQHLHGNAVDLQFSGNQEETNQLISLASSMGFGGIGVYGPGNLHLDVGARRAWGPDYKVGSVPTWAKTAVQAHLAGAPIQAMASTGTGDYSAMTAAAAQKVSVPSALDVSNATAARMAAADAASRATMTSQQQVSEASLAAATAPKPAPAVMGMTRSRSGETAAPGMTQTGEAVDDIVAKILIAMGVVTAT